MTRIELGAKLAQLRQEQGISIRKMAEKAHTAPRAVQAVEKGWYNVGIDTYLAMCDVLGAKLQIRASKALKSSSQ